MTDYRYEAFELRLTAAGEDIYHLEVTASPQGEQPSPVAIHIPVGQVAFPRPGDDLVAFGRRLWGWLFPPPAEALYRAALAALPSGVGLRLRLRIDPPQLAAIPWELAYDPVRDAFPALSKHTPLVRYLALAFRPSPLAGPTPLRMLFVASAPTDVMPLDAAAEKDRLLAALADLRREGRAVVDVLEGKATVEALQDALRGGYRALHFSGHGREGKLALERKDGTAHWVAAGGLAVLLGDSDVSLALLNACHSGAGPGGPFAGVGPALVQAGLPAVVAMQAPLPDESAVCFTRGFYAALADGLAVDAAVAEGRKAVSFVGDGSQPDWAMPVLYLRASDGVLWDFESEEGREVTQQGDVYERITITGGVVGAIGGRNHHIEQRVVQGDVVHGDKVMGDKIVTGDGAPSALRQPVEPEMIFIPDGEFLMGSDLGDEHAHPDEKPLRRVRVPGFFIGKYPVTNAQYMAFVKATEHHRPCSWRGKKIPLDKEQHPVTDVAWKDADAYCTWLTGVTGKPYRLPTEIEWERAARGDDGRFYPWGNAQPTAELCNFNNNVGDTTPVGRYLPQGDSPYSCADMAGNVCEWTQGFEDDYPYDPNSNDGQRITGDEALRVVRGGAFNNEWQDVRCAIRELAGPQVLSFRVGFRVAISSAS